MRRLSVLLASVVMAMTLIAIAVAVGASAAPNKIPANHFYGAVDYSQKAATWFWGHGRTKQAANRAAYNHCHVDGGGVTDCKTVVWVYNGWVSVATSKNYGGAGWGRTKKQAQSRALFNCARGPAPPCKVIGSSQTARDWSKKTKGGYSLPGP